MTAQYLNIEAKHRQTAGFIASMKDFTVSAGEMTDAGIILANPDISLYCFDDETGRAIFVELPPGINLAAVPFVYQTQYDQALRLIAVPYDTFRSLAQTLPPVQHLIMVYITGRSGSTLLSHVFNELDTVMSLSEPDVMTQFLHLRGGDHTRDPELRELLDCTVRILFKPNPFKTPATYALKGRNETVQVMDLYQTTFPHVNNLFLYRDAAGFAGSFYRLLKNVQVPDYMAVGDYLAMFSAQLQTDLTPTLAYLEPDAEQISTIQVLTLWWMMVMEFYLEQAARGIPVLPVNYTDLNADREPVISAIFAHCGLPVAEVPKALRAFDRDAQAGTPLQREIPTEGNRLRLTDAQQQDIANILRQHPVIQHSDFIVPGTLSV
jgi:hypothetical protein